MATSDESPKQPRPTARQILNRKPPGKSAQDGASYYEQQITQGTYRVRCGGGYRVVRRHRTD